jgi:hypothetical protein
MQKIIIQKYVGTFAENKDVARTLRVERIMPALEKDQTITLDFQGITGATQSFVHALISDTIRHYGDHVLDLLTFKNRSPVVQEIVIAVTEYMQVS